MKEVDRVNLTIDRLVSNLPSAIEALKGAGKHNLARQIMLDLDNLEYWQRRGGLQERGGHWYYYDDDDALRRWENKLPIDTLVNRKLPRWGERNNMIDISKIKFQHSLYEYHTVGQVLAALVANFGMPVILAELSKIAERDKRETQELIAKE